MKQKHSSKIDPDTLVWKKEYVFFVDKTPKRCAETLNGIQGVPIKVVVDNPEIYKDELSFFIPVRVNTPLLAALQRSIENTQ